MTTLEKHERVLNTWDTTIRTIRAIDLQKVPAEMLNEAMLLKDQAEASAKMAEMAEGQIARLVEAFELLLDPAKARARMH